MGFNRQMLPANVSARDIIEIEESVKNPISLILKNPPKLLERIPTSPSGRAEDIKEMDASEFPKLRGFA